MRVPLLDLSRQYGRVRAAIQSGVGAVFESQQFILGRTVEDFEKEFAALTGADHAIGMSSGTDAQLAILMAMGIGQGDAVITTPYTFFATAGCIHRVGAEIVFVDIEPSTLHLDAGKLSDYLAGCKEDADGFLRTAKGNRIRAVVPVHLFGVCCDFDRLLAACAPHNLPLIEDAAQAIGAQYQGADGQVRQAGCLGDSAYFSFFPTKNLGAAGDAGMATCQSEELAEALKRERNHGMEQRYFHRHVGGNFRLDAIQAAVLQAKLPYVAEWNAARRANADAYREGFASLADQVSVPAEPWKAAGLKDHHTYHQYVIRAKNRDALLAHLAQQEIGHAVYYPVALHLQECFRYLGYREGDCPEAERASRETVALPIFPELTEAETAAVVAAVRSFYS